MQRQDGHDCQDQSRQCFLYFFSANQQYWVAGDTRLRPWWSQHQFCHWQWFCCTYPQIPPQSEVPTSQELLSLSVPAFPHHFWRQKWTTFPQARTPSSTFSGAQVALGHCQQVFHGVNDFEKLQKALMQREKYRTKFIAVGARASWDRPDRSWPRKIEFTHPREGEKTKQRPQTNKLDPRLWKVNLIRRITLYAKNCMDQEKLYLAGQKLTAIKTRANSPFDTTPYSIRGNKKGYR